LKEQKKRGGPISIRNIDYEFSPERFEKATERKKKLEAEGYYNKEKIKYVTINQFDENEIRNDHSIPH